MDETTQQSQAMLTRGSPAHQLWTWYRRLGHPSLPYLKHLFPSLKNTVMSLDCESCVLAKSHKHSYFSSFPHSTSPFTLIHSDMCGHAPILLLIISLIMFYLWMIVLV